MQISKFKTLW